MLIVGGPGLRSRGFAALAMRAVLPTPWRWLHHAITAHDEVLLPLVDVAMALIDVDCGSIVVVVVVAAAAAAAVGSCTSHLACKGCVAAAAAAVDSCTSHPACKGCAGCPKVPPANIAYHAFCSYKGHLEAHLARSCQRPAIAVEDHLGKKEGGGHCQKATGMQVGALASGTCANKP